MGRKKRKSALTSLINYIRPHWLKLILWLVGGGIITLVATWKLITSGPDIEIKAEYMAYAESYITGTRRKCHNFTLDFAIINNGDKPYFPNKYRLSVNYGDKKVMFYALSVPDSAIVANVGPMTVTYDVKKDLTRVVKIDPSEIVVGFVEFFADLTSDNNDLNQSNYKYFQLEIMDIDGKIIKSIKYPHSPYSIRNEYHPRSGTEYRKR